jgi:hypothetical protein
VKKERSPIPFFAVLAEDLAEGPYAPRRELSFAAPRPAPRPTPAPDRGRA